jgi:hypothetical protein
MTKFEESALASQKKEVSDTQKSDDHKRIGRLQCPKCLVRIVSNVVEECPNCSYNFEVSFEVC